MQTIKTSLSIKSIAIVFTVVINTPFLKAQENSNCNCCTPEHRQFDFWIGDWDVYDAKGLAGTNKIVFYREKGDGMDQLYFVKSDGSGLKKITNDRFNNIYLGWTPDGKTVVYSCGEFKGKPAVLRTIDIETGVISSIGGIASFWGRISPDGKKVAYVTGQWPNASIKIANTDGTEIVEISK